MHASQNKHAAHDRTVGGFGADMPAMPGQLELHQMTAADLMKMLTRFRWWMDSEWAGGATHVPIAAVDSYFGWPRR